MSPLIFAALGVAVFSVLATAVILVTVLRRPPAPTPQMRVDEVARRLAEVLPLFRSAVTIIGPHDEVIGASPYATGIGLVRGARVLPRELVDELRRWRGTGESHTYDLRLGRGLTLDPISLSIRGQDLGDGYLIFVADDRAEALRVDAARRDFMTNITHELKTPVGAIQLLAEATLAASDDPAAVTRFSGKLLAESERLGELVAQIISWSKLQSVDPLVSGQTVEITELVNGVVASAHTRAQDCRVTLTATAAEPMSVVGDEQALRMALSNLISNALTYTEGPGRVTVTTTTVDELVQISVSDTGIGIAETDLDKVFERFYRVSQSRARAEGGTGLGLAIVKLIAESHGGSVSVWSKLGRGSTFTISLPKEVHDENLAD